MIARSLTLEDEESRIVAALPADLREALDGYLRALEADDRAPSTRRVYQSRVTGYLGWLSTTSFAQTALRDPLARNEAVAGYQRWLRDEQGRALSAVNAVLVAVDDFYRHRGLGAAVVTRDVVTAPVAEGLDERSLAAISAAVGGEGAGVAEAARERAVLDLMRFAGLAGAEVAALDLADVQLSGAAAHVRVGGRAARTVPLQPALTRSLRAWLKVRDGWAGAESSAALFVNRFGQRLSARFCTMIVQQVGERAGVSVTPATLRATFANSLHSAGVEPAVIAALTGRRLSGPDVSPPLAALLAAVRRLAGHR